MKFRLFFFLHAFAHATSLTDYWEAKKALVALPESELLVASEDLGQYSIHRPFRSLSYKRFRGFPDLSVLPLIQKLVTDPDECMYLFQWLMVGRPDWLSFHRSEISTLKMCTCEIIEKISNPQNRLSEPIFIVLDNFIRQVLDALYDPSTEIALRRDIFDSSSSSPLFRKYMLKLLDGDLSASPLLTRIAASLNTPIDVGVLYETEGAYFRDLVSSNYSAKLVNHYGEFLTGVFGKAADCDFQHEVLGFFKLVLDRFENFDAIDSRITESEILMSSPAKYAESRAVFFQAEGMGLTRGSFVDFPGKFIVLLWTANADNPSASIAINSCFPEAYRPLYEEEDSEIDGMWANVHRLFDHFDGRNFLPLMTCLIDGVLDQSFAMPKADPDFRRATAYLVYGILLTRSAANLSE